MDLKRVVQWLMDNGYGLIVNNQFVLTQKLQHELFSSKIVLSIDQRISGPTTNTTIGIMPTASNTAVRLAAPDEKKAVWNQFIERAGIPHRVKGGDGGVYTVRQYSPSAVGKLIQIIKSGIDYDKLVASTKHYYATVSYKALLSNYLLKDIWKDEYDNYSEAAAEKEVPREKDGSSRWED